MKSSILFIIIIFGLCPVWAQKYSTSTGHIHFISNAPLELIEANSNVLKGVLDKESQKFAFEVTMKTFDGFNSPLQREHFFENYMEVKSFPHAQFVGKILEPLEQGKEYYRAKGILTIHGTKKNVLIDIQLQMQEESFLFESTFVAALVDFNIKLPKIVYQKVAEKITVRVNGVLNQVEL